jgi:Ca2+-binding EF-hand superfamily protein
MNSLIMDGNIETKTDEEAFEKSARELFESIDKDGDGFIGANELMNYLTGTFILFAAEPKRLF